MYTHQYILKVKSSRTRTRHYGLGQAAAARWFETAVRTVAVDEIGGERISTVFLGWDHSWDVDWEARRTTIRGWISW